MIISGNVLPIYVNKVLTISKVFHAVNNTSSKSGTSLINLHTVQVATPTSPSESVKHHWTLPDSFQQLASHVSLHSLSTLWKMCFHKLLDTTAQQVHNRLSTAVKLPQTTHSTPSKTSKRSNTDRAKERQNLTQTWDHPCRKYSSPSQRRSCPVVGNVKASQASQNVKLPAEQCEQKAPETINTLLCGAGRKQLKGKLSVLKK